MSTILENDLLLPSPSVTLVSASAGSGKTYTLAWRFVQLLLSERIPQNSLSGILALTFTNNAAAEMRQRVLEYLKRVCLGDPPSLSTARELVGGDDDALRIRAGKVLDGIFEDYSQFQVRTIDSFSSRVFQASALEFGFNPDLEILLDGDELIDAAFDLFARDLREGTGKGRLFLELAQLLGAGTDDRRPFVWDVFRKVGAEVKKLIRQLTAKTAALHWADQQEAIASLTDALQRKAQQIQEQLSDCGLEALQQLRADLSLAFDGLWRPLLARATKTKVLKSSELRKGGYAVWSERLDDALREFNGILGELALADARQHYRAYVEALAMLTETLDAVKRRTGRVSIDDVNRILCAHVHKGMVPGIYFRLGETIYHYLLDEFQDTSPVQWAALSPLIDNALAQGGSLFLVGDTKQSIYGFRGADWHIMRDLERRQEAFASAPTRKRELTENRRSYEEVVRYGASVFAEERLAGVLREAAANSGLLNLHQEATADHQRKGHVEVVLHERNAEQPPERETILGIIRSALERGYSYGDIAILTPGNNAVIELSGWLNEARVPFLSHSSLDVRMRRVTGEFIALLKFLDAPVDDLAFATFLLGTVMERLCRVRFPEATRRVLCEAVLSQQGDHSRPLYTLFRESSPRLWEQCFEPLFSVVGYMPLYDLATEIFKRFDLFTLYREEESALAKLLEVTKDLEARGFSGIKDFLELAGDEAAASALWEVDPPRGTDAVQVMTVHKSKGLEFRLVIVLLYDRRTGGNGLCLEETEHGIELLHVLSDRADKHERLQALKQERTLQEATDELNKLYVALTRAKEEMYIVGVHRGTPAFPVSLLPPGPHVAAGRPTMVRSIRRPVLSLAPLQSAIVVRSAPAEAEEISFRESRRSDLLCAILAGIEYLDGEAGLAVDRALAGLPALPLPGEADAARGAALSFLGEAAVAGLFRREPGRVVRNRLEVADGAGGLHRIDRVVEDGDNVTAVLFVTGGDAQGNKSVSRIRMLADLLRRIWPGKQVTGMVADIDRKELRAVQIVRAQARNGE